MVYLKIKSLHRYPVKSMGGEKLQSIQLTKDGIFGDRYWAIYNLDVGELQGARRLPKLLLLKAEYIREPNNDRGKIKITFPDGKTIETDQEGQFQELSDFLGVNVKLCPLKPLMNAAHYKRAVTSNDSEIRKELGIPDNEKTPDFANLPLAKLAALKYFVSPPGHYFDVFPLHLITQGALDYMQNRTNNNNFILERFRPNIVVENNNSEIIEEFSWIDNYVQIASAKIKIEAKTVRCSVPTRQQINIPENKEVIKSIANMNDRFLGVYASVSTTGIIKTADAFKVEIKTKSDSPANYQ